MTTTLAAPTCRAPRTRLAWTFCVEGMPVRERRRVEKQMLLLPDGAPGEIWFTRWQRRADRTYSCRETIYATHEEIEPFAQAMDRLSREKNFVASLTPRSYDGPHVY